MLNLRSRSQLCRWVQADLWGEVLNSRRPLLPLYKAIYNPIIKGPANFVVRIERNRPKPRKRRLSRYARAILGKRTLSAYYSISFNTMRRICKKLQDTPHTYAHNFVAGLESQLHIILWRAGYFKTPFLAKVFVLKGNVAKNFFYTNSYVTRAVPGDYIFFRHLDHNYLYYTVRRGIHHLRNSHLLINYRIPCIHYLAIDIWKLFYYFSIDHSTVFHTMTYRRR